MKTVWIVSEGSPGHVSQSVGLVNALKAHCDLDVVEVTGRLCVRGWVRPILRFLMGKSGRPLPKFLLDRTHQLNVPCDAPAPDLIVSSGGKSVLAARTWAQKFKVPYVFIGERKPYPASWFHTIISPAINESCENSIDVELIPTPVTPQFIAEKGQVEKDTWCMIIGGVSRSHHFVDKDWIAIAEGMNALADRENIRWLITTSRRTGAEAEGLLKQHLKSDVLKDAIWWAEEPRKELYSFMARSELLFVTQDSVTMVTEAVSSGKPVVVVFPETCPIPEDSFMNAYFDRLERNRRLVRLRAESLAAFEFKGEDFSLQEGPVFEQVSEAIAKRVF